jgi:hypothetical protein
VTLKGSGVSTITGLAGENAVTVADGSGVIDLGGTGNTVVTTAGTWDITAGNGHATITTGAANDTILLNGSSDIVHVGGGAVQVNGVGYNTDYILEAADANALTTSQFDVSSFSANAGDVLDLTKLQSVFSASANAFTSQTDLADNTAMDVIFTTGGASYNVATLHGVGSNATLDSLVATNNILVK